MYNEALAQFLTKPVTGYGANLFGLHSCVGANGFPHSTVLQGFAELGVLGGGIFLALVFLAIQAAVKILLLECSGTKGTVLHGWSFHPEGRYAPLFLLAFTVAQLIADQIYGNYFMASSFYLILGIASGLRCSYKHES